MTGVAVNVAEDPGQMVSSGIDIVTDGAPLGSIVMVIAAEVAVAGEAHAADEVTTQDTDWPFVRVLVV